MFDDDCILMDVYHWVGTMDKEIDCFSLCVSPGQHVDNALSVKHIKSVLNMEIKEQPFDDVDELLDLDNADDAETPVKNNNEATLMVEENLLLEKRKLLLSQFVYSEGFFYVSRLNIIEDFKELYQQR